MKKLILFFATLRLFAFALNAQTNVIYFSVADLTQTVQAGIKVQVALVSPLPRLVNGVGIRPDYKPAVTDTNGKAWFTNLVWGNYSGQVFGSPGIAFSFQVLTNSTGLINGWSLPGVTNLPNPLTNFYNISQIDAKLAAIGTGTNGGGTPILNGTGISLMLTNGTNLLSVTLNTYDAWGAAAAAQAAAIAASDANGLAASFAAAERAALQLTNAATTNAVLGALAVNLTTALARANQVGTDGTNNTTAAANAAQAAAISTSTAAMQLTNAATTNAMLGALAANFASALTNLVAPGIFYVQTNGNDSTAVAGDAAHPWQSFTNALKAAEASAPALVQLGVGTFYTDTTTTNGSLVTTNITIAGLGQNLTRLATQTNYVSAGLVLAGDNIALHDLAIGTNTMTAAYYFPVILMNGTNLNIYRVNGYGDSDFFYNNAAYAIRTNVQLTVDSCVFYSGYDCGAFLGANGTSGTNSKLLFKNSDFYVNSDTNFGGLLMRGLYFNRIQATIANCRFFITNAVNTNSSCAAYGIQESSVFGYPITVQNNIYAYSNSVSQAGIQLNSATCSLVVKGTLTQRDLIANGGTVTYDNNYLLSGAGGYNDGGLLTNVPAAGLTGTVPLATSATYATVATNVASAATLTNVSLAGNASYNNAAILTNGASLLAANLSGLVSNSLASPATVFSRGATAILNLVATNLSNSSTNVLISTTTQVQLEDYQGNPQNFSAGNYTDNYGQLPASTNIATLTGTFAAGQLTGIAPTNTVPPLLPSSITGNAATATTATGLPLVMPSSSSTVNLAIANAGGQFYNTSASISNLVDLYVPGIIVEGGIPVLTNANFVASTNGTSVNGTITTAKSITVTNLSLLSGGQLYGNLAGGTNFPIIVVPTNAGPSSWSTNGSGRYVGIINTNGTVYTLPGFVVTNNNIGSVSLLGGLNVTGTATLGTVNAGTVSCNGSGITNITAASIAGTFVNNTNITNSIFIGYPCGGSSVIYNSPYGGNSFMQYLYMPFNTSYIFNLSQSNPNWNPFTLAATNNALTNIVIPIQVQITNATTTVLSIQTRVYFQTNILGAAAGTVPFYFPPATTINFPGSYVSNQWVTLLITNSVPLVTLTNGLPPFKWWFYNNGNVTNFWLNL